MDDRWAWHWVNKYRWALEMRGDVDQDDLFQAAMIGIWEAERTYKPEAGEWSTYSAFWIRHEIRRALGVKRGQLPPPEIHLDEPLTEDAEETRLDMLADDSIPDIDAGILVDEYRQTVRDAVDRLDDQQREVVQKRYFQGKTVQEIADEAGTSYRRIYGLWKNARMRLRRDRLLKELREVRHRYHIHVGLNRFNSTHTSAVEESVIQYERDRNELKRRLNGTKRAEEGG